MSVEKPKIAAVIPCYRERDRILGVLQKFDDFVDHIIVVDDACPDNTGQFVKDECSDERVEVIILGKNLGVGGATITGYQRALELDADILVKVDGDGQMDPAMIPTLVRPILRGAADYAKGNRFYRLEGISSMPKTRLIGNLFLSFATKMSSGYWQVFDPTNGFTALHAKVARLLPLAKIDNSYFFESDMLFQLNISRAVVKDVPMDAIYGDEKSELKISRILLPFIWKHGRNLNRRLLYTYFLRDFNAASMELVFGVLLMMFSIIYGGINWYESISTGVPAATGVVILAAMPFLIGSYLLISVLNFDVQNQPDSPLHKIL